MCILFQTDCAGVLEPLLLHENVWLAIAVQVKERGRMRCRHEFVAVWQLTARVYLRADKERLEAELLPLLTCIVLGNEHLNTVIH